MSVTLSDVNRMGSRTGRRARAVAVLLAGMVIIFGAAAPRPAAAVGDGAPASARAARAVLRAQAGGVLGGEAPQASGGPVRATATAGDAVTISDPADFANPRGDIRQVGVGSGPSGSLIFTMQVEQYTAPATDPSWLNGNTFATWALDTSGDGEAELGIDIFDLGSTLVAEVYDYESFAFVCDAVATSDSVTKTYTATVALPGCFGDVKRPAVAGLFVYDGGVNGNIDLAPSDGTLVRFNRPAAGQPTGGYSIVARNAGFQRFGAIPPGTSTTSGIFEDYIGPNPVVGTASARQFDPGLWSVTDDGEVSTQDGADYYGDAIDLTLTLPIVGMAVLPDRSGYWLVARDGGIFSYGPGAEFYGSTGGIRLDKPIVGMAATPSGQGYWLVASDGGIFAYGDATFYGSTGGIRLNKPVVGMAAGLTGQGYWLVASDGGIFAYGVPFYGSTGAITLAQPIVGMAATRSGGGYRFIARDGGVFNYGDAEFQGSGAVPGRTNVIGLATA